MADIEIKIRINDYYKVHHNNNPTNPIESDEIHDEELKYLIQEVIEKRTKHIKDLSINVSIVEDHEQEAIDIGKNILGLIDKRVEDAVGQISISRC